MARTTATGLATAASLATAGDLAATAQALGVLGRRGRPPRPRTDRAVRRTPPDDHARDRRRTADVDGRRVAEPVRKQRADQYGAVVPGHPATCEPGHTNADAGTTTYGATGPADRQYADARRRTDHGTADADPDADPDPGTDAHHDADARPTSDAGTGRLQELRRGPRRRQSPATSRRPRLHGAARSQRRRRGLRPRELLTEPLAPQFRGLDDPERREQHDQRGLDPEHRVRPSEQLRPGDHQ